MRRRNIPEAEALDRIGALEELGRKRQLTDAESRELEALIYRQSLRERRRPARIAHLRARLAALEANL